MSVADGAGRVDGPDSEIVGVDRAGRARDRDGG